MKNIFCFCLSILIIGGLLTGCQKEKDSQEINPDMEGLFIFEGLIVDKDGTPMDNMEVSLLSVEDDNGQDGLWGPGDPNVRRLPADDNGYYSISIDKKELYDLYTYKNHNHFSLKFANRNTVPVGKFSDKYVRITVDFEKDKLKLDKQMASGGYINVVKIDNPDIEYSTNEEMKISSDFVQGIGNSFGILGGASQLISDPDTLIKRVRASEELPLILSWRATGHFTTYHSQKDTLQVNFGEEQTYWIEY